MKKLLFLIFCLFGLKAYSQALPPKLPNFNVSSPTVEEFKKHLKFPVQLSTGVIKYSYPVFSTTVDGINLSVSLDYHSSGLRVSEKASWVGLGWNLNTGGGIIHRQVRGLPDDNEYGYYTLNNNNQFENFLNLNSNYNNLSQSDKDYVDQFKRNAVINPFDGQPDIFSYSIMGNSGRFLIHPNGDIVIIEGHESKIAGSISTGFTITDSKGNEYIFNNSHAEEVEVVSDSEFNEYSYKSAWKLSEISTYKGGHIFYFYTTNIEQVYSTPSQVFKYTQTNGVKSFSSSTTSSETFSSQKLIDSIVFQKGTINFLKSNQREDFGKKLTKIIIKNQFNQQKVRYLFDYDYSPRLLLKSIQREVDGFFSPKTEFYYFGGSLPIYNSKAIDLWGFYNGVNSNQSYIPKDEFLAFANHWGNGSSNLLADRSPNLSSTKIGVLKEVKYPTGGKMKLEYELNDFGYINGGVFQELSSPDEYTTEEVTNVVSCTAEYGSNTNGCINSANLIPNCNNNTFESDVSYNYVEGEAIKTFVAPESFNDYFFIYGTLDGAGDSIGSSIELRDSYGNTVFSYQNTNGKTYPTLDNPIKEEDYNIVRLNQGETYTLVARTDDDCRGSFISIEKINSSLNSLVTKTIGGVRVKRISKFDENNNLKLVKEYSYNIEKDSLRSSGVVKVRYLRKMNTTTNVEPASQEEHEHIYIYSDPLIDFGTSKGSHVAYKKVTEKLIDYTNNKSQLIEHFYTSPYDYNDDYGNPQFPFVTRINNNYRIGLLDSTIIYNESVAKVKINKKDYLFKNSINSKKLIGLSFGASEFQYGFPLVSSIKFHQYKFKTKNNSLINKEKVIEYMTDIEDINSNTSYYYDNPNHLQPTRIETINSKEEKIKTKISYAYEVNDERLINEHRISEPIKVETYKKVESTETKLSEQRTFYRDFSGNYLPEFVKTSKGSNPLEDRVVYHSYDNKGNPQEISKKEGTRIVYIWGYNQAQPIAKIENATYSQVSNYVSDLQIKSNADNDRTLGLLGKEGQLRGALSTLRNALPTAQVTTFTYDPLIGVTSITDPRGETIYYEYDEFNRLKHVKDKDGNILSENKYNYKN